MIRLPTLERSRGRGRGLVGNSEAIFGGARRRVRRLAAGLAAQSPLLLLEEEEGLAISGIESSGVGGDCVAGRINGAEGEIARAFFL